MKNTDQLLESLKHAADTLSEDVEVARCHRDELSMGDPQREDISVFIEANSQLASMLKLQHFFVYLEDQFKYKYDHYTTGVIDGLKLAIIITCPKFIADCDIDIEDILTDDVYSDIVREYKQKLAEAEQDKCYDLMPCGQSGVAGVAPTTDQNAVDPFAAELEEAN